MISSSRTEKQTGKQKTHTKVTTEGTLSGVQEFFLQPIIKDRPNMVFIAKMHTKKNISLENVEKCDSRKTNWCEKHFSTLFLVAKGYIQNVS